MELGKKKLFILLLFEMNDKKWKRAENLWRQNSWERKHFVRREIATNLDQKNTENHPDDKQ